MFKIYPKWLEFLRIKALMFFQRYSLPRWIVFGLDIFAVFLIFLFAYILRFNFVFTDFEPKLAINQAFIAVSIYAVFEILFRSYSGLIRHTTIIDIFIVFMATSSSLTVLLGLTLLGRKMGWGVTLNIPISIILIHYVTITLLLFFVRIIIKIGFQLISTSGGKKNVLIFGAGDMGVIVKRLINSDIQSSYKISGFLDFSKRLQGKKLNGIPVFNPNVLNSVFLLKHKIDTLILAVENISSKKKSEIICKAMDLDLKILETPAVEKWLNGQLRMDQIRKVKIKDLLGRDPIKLNLELIGKGLKGKTILVTGAAGSIGSEIVRQIARFTTRKVVLIDQAETPMFHLENELRDRFSNMQFQLLLADVTNCEKMKCIFQEFHPEIVFHAAAYKHVPLMEENPHEAIRVNVGGTKIITELAVKYEVEKFVMISTDKSVNPSSVMGASKRVCEMIVQSRAQQPGVKTKFVITRFGNVLGSNGSVVPLFSKQIEAGGPVTVTHPEITRYFMTIPEACELVLEAGFMGRGDEIYVFDMGKPIKIADLAHQMIQLSGLIPGKDIQIVYTGLRPGEKLYEELLSDKENTLPTYHPKIKIAQVEKHDYTQLTSRIDSLLKSIYTMSKQEVIDFFKEIVPEYRSNNVLYNGKLIKKEPIEVDSIKEKVFNSIPINIVRLD
jgi:FlaA1/EpsC-like NDP-sugar epimerase